MDTNCDLGQTRFQHSVSERHLSLPRTFYVDIYHDRSGVPLSFVRSDNGGQYFFIFVYFFFGDSEARGPGDERNAKPRVCRMSYHKIQVWPAQIRVAELPPVGTSAFNTKPTGVGSEGLCHSSGLVAERRKTDSTPSPCFDSAAPDNVWQTEPNGKSICYLMV
jgi:hypothetical protein